MHAVHTLSLLCYNREGRTPPLVYVALEQVAGADERTLVGRQLEAVLEANISPRLLHRGRLVGVPVKRVEAVAQAETLVSLWRERYHLPSLLERAPPPGGTVSVMRT